MEYKTLSLNDRIKKAVADMVAAGVPKNKAQSLAALSVVETGAIWVTARLPSMWYDYDCWKWRVTVGLELGEPIYARTQSGAISRTSDGAPIIDVTLIRSSASSDPDAVQYLLGKGWIAQLPANKVQYVKNQKAPFYVVTGALAGVGTQGMAEFFEWVMDKRKGALLNNFSLGPSMMWMAYSGEGQRAGLVPLKDAAWPDTWDDIFDFYVTTDAGTLGKEIIYLDQKRTGMVFYPADDPNNSARIINWLTYHVGNAAGAADYYNNLYKARLSLVLSIT